MRRVFAANWKMNHGPTAARAFVRAFLERCTPAFAEREVIFFPPALSLHVLADAFAAHPEVGLGVQNIYWESAGAFTGEVSAPMAVDAGARYALVGHSERRHIFHETNEDTGRKCAAAIAARLVPVLCVGEQLDERERGDAQAVVVRQLDAAAGTLALDPNHRLLVAYEPVWAIGTGRTATPDDASAMHTVIRRRLHDLLADRAADVPVLYGGSVNRANAGSLLSAPGVDGLLVGGASLDAASWADMVCDGR